MLTAILTFAVAVTVASCQQTTPASTDSRVDSLAESITNGLMNSDVLEKALPFTVKGPQHIYNVFFRVGTKLLTRAGMNNSVLADVAASAAQKAGEVTSELYFRSVGYEVATYVDSFGLLDNDANVKYYSFMVVRAVELEACTHGVDDAETVTTAVVYGLYDFLNALGLISPENIAKLFQYFSYEILYQDGKSTYVDVLVNKKIQL